MDLTPMMLMTRARELLSTDFAQAIFCTSLGVSFNEQWRSKIEEADVNEAAIQSSLLICKLFGKPADCEDPLGMALAMLAVIQDRSDPNDWTSAEVLELRGYMRNLVGFIVQTKSTWLKLASQLSNPLEGPANYEPMRQLMDQLKISISTGDPRLDDALKN